MKAIIKRIETELEKDKSRKLHAKSYNLGLLDAVKLITKGRENEIAELIIKKGVKKWKN